MSEESDFTAHLDALIVRIRREVEDPAPHTVGITNLCGQNLLAAEALERSGFKVVSLQRQWDESMSKLLEIRDKLVARDKAITEREDRIRQAAQIEEVKAIAAHGFRVVPKREWRPQLPWWKRIFSPAARMELTERAFFTPNHEGACELTEAARRQIESLNPNQPNHESTIFPQRIWRLLLRLWRPSPVVPQWSRLARSPRKP